MKSEKNSKVYKIFIILPVALFVLSIQLFIISAILEAPTSRGAIYSLCSTFALISFALSVFPGIILTIVGTILAAIAKNIKFLILGIIEILAAAGGIFFIWYLIFIVSPGV